MLDRAITCQSELDSLLLNPLTVRTLMVVEYPNYFPAIELSKFENIEAVHINRGVKIHTDQLFTALGKCLKLNRVSIHTGDIEKVPEMLSLLPRLQFMDLSNNKINSNNLLPTLNKFKSLKELDLSCNNIDKFIVSEENHIFNITDLDLADNNLTIFQDDHEKFKNIQYIRLDNNPNLNWDNTFKTLSQYKNLINLSVANCGLHEIPSSIRLMTKLWYLNISKNKISHTTNEIKSLKNLIVVGIDSSSKKR